jgi:polyisoprenoid-binding protein YceI
VRTARVRQNRGSLSRDQNLSGHRRAQEESMAAEKWNLDVAHSSIGFWVRHLMVTKVHGRFTKWSGSLMFDEQDPSLSSVEVQIDVASVDTSDAQRDGHLKSPDFFDVEKYPQITFKSTRVEPKGDGHYAVTGDFTLRGVTHPVVLDTEYAGRAKHPMGGERAGFSAHTSINRKDYGVAFNMVLDTGGLAVSEKVEINLDVQAVKA